MNVKDLSALFMGDNSVATAEFAAAEHAALSSYLSLSTIVANPAATPSPSPPPPSPSQPSPECVS